MDKFEIAANLALFLTEKTGTATGTFAGKMKAREQRGLFGLYLGKGKIVIDGEKETLRHIIKVCFGLDYDITFDKKWNEIPATINHNKE